MRGHNLSQKIVWLALFGITMGYFEAALVVYLRELYYPAGFVFPLTIPSGFIMKTEVGREAASVLMLVSVAFIAGKRFWERFACFILTFGVWDIFYYVWLKVLLDWPSSLSDWDVLFLIPIPWIGPVIAPLSIAVLMIVFSIMMLRAFRDGIDFKPTAIAYLLGLAGTMLVLYSFMYDLDATLRQAMPKPFRYEIFIAGDLCFIAAFLVSYVNCKGTARRAPPSP